MKPSAHGRSIWSGICLAAALATFAPAIPLRAGEPTDGAHAFPDSRAFEADRAAILAMAGDFKVTFDMRETTPWRADYTPIRPTILGAHESVRVIEDTGRHIVLQHFLVVGSGGASDVIKHWRQDWAYEPEAVLVYSGQGRWTLADVPSEFRKGGWSQTVWQTDDSPRYGGWGRWTDEGGIRRWQSSTTWRPLARRDAVRHPPYDRYLGINRHSPSPTGWVHWQDNIKIGPEPGKPEGALVPFVQESVLNSYVRDRDYDVAAADAYWNATKDYWSAIRAAWSEVIARDHGVSVPEVADTGSASGEQLMGLADDIVTGKLTTAVAVKRGRAVILKVTSK